MNSSLPPSCAACDSILPQYYDGDLEPALHAEVVDHLTHCSRCIDAVADLSVAMGALHRIPQPELGDLSQQTASALSKLSLAQRWYWRPRAILTAASLLFACSVSLGFWMARITESPLEDRLKAQGLIATSEGWMIPTVLGERQAGRIWLNGRWTNRTAAAEQLLSEQGYSLHTDAWLKKDTKEKFIAGEVLTSSGWTTVYDLVPPLLTKQGLSRVGDSWIDAKDINGLRQDGSPVAVDQLVNERLIALGYVHANDGVWRLAEEESRIAQGEVRVGDTWTTVQAIAQKGGEARALELANEEKKRAIPVAILAMDPPAPAPQTSTAISLGWKGVMGVPNVPRAPKPLGTATNSLSQIRDGEGGKHQQLDAHEITARKITVKKSTNFLSASIISIATEFGYGWVGTPAVIAGRVHLSGNSSTVYAMDLETNKGNWKNQLSDTAPSNPVGYDESDVAYTTGSCTLYTLSGNNGSVKMNKWVSGVLRSMPVANEKNLVTTMPGWIVAIHGENGYPQWATSMPSEVRTGVLAVSNKLYCTTIDGTLIACEGKTGKEIWRNRIGGVSSPTIRGKDLYVRRLLHNKGALGESIAVLDAENGQIRTESLGAPRILKALAVQPSNPSGYALYDENPSGSELKLANNRGVVPNFGTALISEKSSIVLSEHIVEARSVTDGQVIWQTSIPISGEKSDYVTPTHEHTDPVIAGNLVILGCLDGQVRALDIATGKILWSVNVESAMGNESSGKSLMGRRQPTVVSGRIYITTLAGELVVIDTGNRLLNGPRWWGDQK